MQLSPSEIFYTALNGTIISLPPYLRVLKHHTRGRVRVDLRIRQNSEESYHKSYVVANPLAMMQAIDILKKERAKRIDDREMPDIVARYPTRVEIAQEFLKEARSMVDVINQKKKIEQQKAQERQDMIVKNVRQPIQAILQRVAPIADPWAYRNVYGKPAEVFIF